MPQVPAGHGPRVGPVDELAPELAEGALQGLRVAAMHGRMAPDDKDAVMTSFAAGEVDVLVSTTVIEVGVDVPNASIMIIDNAERLGLSQLHQLRGRVGRGADGLIAAEFDLAVAQQGAQGGLELVVTVVAARADQRAEPKRRHPELVEGSRRTGATC